eukprot:gene13048-20917_t
MTDYDPSLSESDHTREKEMRKEFMCIIRKYGLDKSDPTQEMENTLMEMLNDLPEESSFKNFVVRWKANP